MNICGAYTALVTPFNNDYSIDYKSLAQLIKYQMDGGINQYVVTGSTGEGTLLSFEEKCVLTKKVIGIVGESGSVGMGCSTGNIKEAIQLVSLAQECGASFALVAPPYYVKPSQDGIIQFYTAIANCTTVPIVAYNIPSRVSVNMTIDTLTKISTIPNVVALKDATGNLATISQLSCACPQFKVLSGDDITFPASLVYGASGTISAISNYCPNLVRNIYENRTTPNLVLVNNLVKICQASSAVANPIALKYLLSKKGIIKNILRPPLLPLNNSQASAIDDIFGEIGML